ncbi:hypothetical protein SPACI_051900 [Sporomusa acidovorans DSM 3132]|uniref:Zinc-ribbon domain-containing protein n=1 Tax=Sporomusa acidovorans (strain ATCC 49682 / DSM 3132 / Mol) TaxID=1123286 RepID=A0ABZ3JAB0_SPOA4|nr:hypothetical protein SPACI_19250 [Sporomusa acidovorans DSM 3132]SDD54829.1 hypothetical protein SAMN04488499_10028 [Sporomusa acidovorans]
MCFRPPKVEKPIKCEACGTVNLPKSVKCKKCGTELKKNNVCY